MNKESNGYTLLFASVMVVIVALVLSYVHQTLLPTQERNEKIDKIEQILRSIKTESTNKDAEAKYSKLVVDAYLIDMDGNKIPDSKEAAFETNMKMEITKPEADRRYPIFEAKVDGETKYIMALQGRGLWGPIWGYISVNADANTVYGADFSHEGETPGLGAEIAKPAFGNEFQGKHLFRDGQFTSVAVVKHGKTDAAKDYVDGISGGTITSKGVDKMLYETLQGYSNFLTKLEKK